MASTTLVTFLFQAPKPVARVELLGSWDNFRKPYPMQKDKASGSLDWRGCHSFTDIVCDGDALEGNSVKRDGGLRMGGTYWYFYRLDDDYECCDTKEPSTTACPLLPGQCVNVLDVPTQLAYPSPKANYSTLSLTEQSFTLDPADKFVTPKLSSANKPRRFRINRTHRLRTVSKGESTLSKMTRWTKDFFVHSRPASPGFDSLRSPSIETCFSAPVPKNRWASKSLFDLRPYRSAEGRVKTWLPRQALDVLPDGQIGSIDSSIISGDGASHATSAEWEQSLQHYEDQAHAGSAFDLDTLQNFEKPFGAAAGEHSAVSIAASEPNDSGSLAPAPESTSNLEPKARPTAYSRLKQENEYSIASSSKRTSGVFSLSESMDGLSHFASPQHRHSQPLTPSVSDFGEFVLEGFHVQEPPTGDAFDSEQDLSRRRSGFTGYNLPDAQHASAITLRAAEPNQRSKRPTLDSAFASRELVEQWNDGSDKPSHPNQKSALQDLVDEMGYLRSLI